MKDLVDIYPNPFIDNIRINDIIGPFTYTINNLTGQLLIKGTSNNNKIDRLNQLEKGIYILTISMNSGNFKYKIIKE